MSKRKKRKYYNRDKKTVEELLGKNLKIIREDEVEHIEGNLHYKFYLLEARNKKSKEEGIKILSENVKGNYFHGPGIWIPKRVDYMEVIRKLFYRVMEFVFGKDYHVKDIKHEVESEKLEEKVKELTQQLSQKEMEVEFLRSEKDKIEQELDKLKKDKELAKELSRGLSEYEEALEEFIKKVEWSKVNNKGIEDDIRKFLYSNTWILGIDCEAKATKKDVDPSSEIDLHIVTNFNEDKIFELKSPNLDPFTIKKKDKRPEPTKYFMEGLNQLIDYMSSTDLYSRMESSRNYKIRNPNGVFVIGYNLPKEQKDMLKEWNKHIGQHIRIVTYNEIINSANRSLEIIRSVKK